MFDPAIGRWISEDPIEFEAGDENLNRYVGNDPINKTDPSGLYDIEWGGYWQSGNWTEDEKKIVGEALYLAFVRAKKLRQQIQSEITTARLTHCGCGQEMVVRELTRLDRVMKGIEDGYLSNSEKLEIYHYGFGKIDPVARAWPAGWYGIAGGYSDGQIELNDDALPSTWYEAGKKNIDDLARYMFHELTHLYGTEDDDSEGDFHDAWQITSLYEDDLSNWPPLKRLKAKAEEACKRLEETEPGLETPPFYFF